MNPGDNGFGDANDSIADPAGVLATTSAIGAITVNAGVLAAADGVTVHQFAITTARLKDLKFGVDKGIKDFATALCVDGGTAGDDADDILVRII